MNEKISDLKKNEAWPSGKSPLQAHVNHQKLPGRTHFTLQQQFEFAC